MPKTYFFGKKDICVKDDMGSWLGDVLYEHEADLKGVFVQGAPALMTVNLNATSGLANGTPVSLHSVIFKEDLNAESIRRERADAQPGTDVIQIPVRFLILFSFY